MAAILGFYVGQSYGDRPIQGAMIGLGAFLLMSPLAAGTVMGSNTYYLGSKGIMLAIVLGLSAPTAFHYLVGIEAFQIKMPAGVPPAVGASFSALIPFALTLGAFALIQPV